MTAPHQSAPDSTGAILADILAGAARLVRGEIALARAEVAQKVRSVALAGVQFTIAVVLGVTAMNLLAGAGVGILVDLGLSTAMAALVLGLAFLALAYGFVRWGLFLLSPAYLTPSRSLFNLGRDAAALKTMVKSDDRH